MGGGAGGPARARGRAHRLGQDPCGVPVGAGPAGGGQPAAGSAAPLPGPLRLAAQGPGRRRAAQPARAAHGHPAGGAAGRHAAARDHGGDAYRRHPGRRAAAVRPHAAGRAGHHAGVAVPAAHLGGPRVVARRAHGHPGRGARGGGHQARRAPRAVAGAARRAARARPAQRIGLSATVRPLDEVATFLAGARPVEIVQPPAAKTIEVAVEVPVPDLAALDERPAPGSSDEEVVGSAAGTAQRPSIWPAVERRLLDLVRQHRSTIVFANSRRLAERLDGAAERARGRGGGRRRWGWTRSFPAEAVGQSGIGGGAPPVVAKAHHGSMSREQRTVVEEELKGGLLPCVVATSSLELGIDMGAVDLVVQVEAPPSVASGLQRVGRAGHQVGAVSRGVVFPKYRGDLVSCTVVAERMTAGAIESLRYPRNPLDVLAQHVVAMVALEPWTVGDLARGGTAGRAVRGAAGLRAARRAGHAGGPVPVGGVRRAAGADHVGPGHGRAARPPGRAAAGGHLRRHHPGPRPVHGHHAGRRGRSRVAGR